jgi:hypothetical protein
MVFVNLHVSKTIQIKFIQMDVIVLIMMNANLTIVYLTYADLLVIPVIMKEILQLDVIVAQV